MRLPSLISGSVHLLDGLARRIIRWGAGFEGLLEPPEPEHRIDPLLRPSVILLDHTVEALARPNADQAQRVWPEAVTTHCHVFIYGHHRLTNSPAVKSFDGVYQLPIQ